MAWLCDAILFLHMPRCKLEQMRNVRFERVSPHCMYHLWQSFSFILLFVCFSQTFTKHTKWVMHSAQSTFQPTWCQCMNLSCSLCFYHRKTGSQLQDLLSTTLQLHLQESDIGHIVNHNHVTKDERSFLSFLPVRPYYTNWVFAHIIVIAQFLFHAHIVIIAQTEVIAVPSTCSTVRYLVSVSDLCGHCDILPEERNSFWDRISQTT